MTDDRPPILGGGFKSYDDKRLETIFVAMLDYLEDHPTYHGAHVAPGDIVTGCMIIPVIERPTPEGRRASTGLLHFVRPDTTIPTEVFADGLNKAVLRWYGFANSERVNVLDAYVAGDIEWAEIPGLLDEPIDTTARCLGMPGMPVNRDMLGKVLAAIRARLAES